MIIGVDFHAFSDASQGIKTYLLSLYKQIIKLNKKHEILIFVDNPKKLKNEHPEFAGDNIKLIKLKPMNRYLRLLFYFPYLKYKYSVDLFHFQFIAPPLILNSSIVTIHDVLYEDFPEYFSRFFVFRSKILIRLSALFSKHILTISNYSKSRIIHHYKIKEDKISVHYLAADDESFSETKPDQKIDVLEQLNLLNTKYIFIHGRLDRRKNHILILHALKHIKNKHLKLVITGFGIEKTNILKEAKKHSVESRVIFTGDIDQESLNQILRNAFIFVFPSHCEGFGLPVIEAQLCNVPVICSNNTSLNELFADSSLQIDSNSVEDLVNNINDLTESEYLRNNLIIKGKLNCNRFSFLKSAKVFLETVNNI